MIVYGLSVIMLLMGVFGYTLLGWDLCLRFPDYPGPLSFLYLFLWLPYLSFIHCHCCQKNKTK